MRGSQCFSIAKKANNGKNDRSDVLRKSSSIAPDGHLAAGAVEA